MDACLDHLRVKEGRDQTSAVPVRGVSVQASGNGVSSAAASLAHRWHRMLSIAQCVKRQFEQEVKGAILRKLSSDSRRRLDDRIQPLDILGLRCLVGAKVL